MLGSVVKHTFHAAKDSTAETVPEQAPCSPAWSMPCKSVFAPNQPKVLAQLENREGFGLDFRAHSQ